MRLVIILMAIFLSSCASLHSVSMTQVPQNRGKPIMARSSSWGLFGIYFSNDFVNEAIDGLKNRCQRGKVTGVFTKYESRNYFLWTTRTVNANAFCVTEIKT